MTRLLICLMTVLTSAATTAGRTGTVTEVISGDSFLVDDSLVVVLKGVDAIEVPRQWGPNLFPWTYSKERLSSLILGRQVKLSDTDDRHRFVVARVHLDTLDVNLTMVIDGYCGVELRGDCDQASEFLEAEIEARKMQRGLWRIRVSDQLFVVPSHEHIDTSAWKLYTDDLNEFEITLPNDASLARKADGVAISIPALKGTHVLNAELSVKVSDLHGRGCACRPTRAELEWDQLYVADSVFLGDSWFFRRIHTEGATGTEYYISRYCIFGITKCYILSYVLTFTNPYMLSCPMPDFDREKEVAAANLLRNIISTFNPTE